MNVFDLQATLGLDSSGYSAGLRQAKGEASSFASSFKKIVGGLAIGGGAVLAAGGTAVAKIVKSAVSAYKDYEQLVGGVETLFGTGGKSLEQYADGASDSMYKLNQRGEEVLALQKELIEAGYDVGEAGADGIYGPKTRAAFDAYAKEGGQLVKDAYNRMAGVSDKVIANADQAYQTAGLSANEYMETVTSFSASLINSLGGDTDKAADVADMAIRDMSDNANKMGTSMESIQNAYAGFARGNFMMLDNLKLGYSGTREGMQALIKKANELRKAQGKTADLTIDSYADIVEAIHAVQEDWGITGTTAAEAADTIEGSLNSTKAAWKNLLTSFATGKDINKRLDSLVSSAKNVVKNVVPVISTSLKSVGTFFGEVAPIIAQELPNIITDAVPSFLGAIGSLAGSLISNFPAMLSGIGSAIKTAITGSDDASWAEVGAQIWEKIKSGISATGDWLKGLVGLTPDDSWSEFGLVIWEKVKSGINATGDWLKEQLGYTPDASWSEIGTQLWETVKSGISGTGDWLKEKLGYSPDSSWSQIGADIWSIIKQGISDTGDWLKGQLGYTPDDSWSQIGADIWEMVKSGISATGDWLKSALGYTPSDEWSTVGKDILEKIKGGIGDVASVLTGLFESASTAISTIDWTSVGSGIWNAIKAGIGGLFSVFQSLFGEGKDGAEAVDWAGLGASILNAVTTALASIGETIFGFFSAAWADITADPALIALGDTIKKPFDDAWTAIQSAWNGAASWFDGIISGVQTTFDNIATAVNSALTAVSDFFGFSPTDIFSSVAESIAGTFAKIAGAVQGAIDKVREFFGLTRGEEFTRTEPRKSAGLGVLPQYNARAMNTGHIFNRPTLFGFADGKFQVAGDAGAEAVVGVNSLDSMIQKAVSNAMAGVLGKMDELRAGQGRDMQLVLDSGELVGGIANKMNRRLGSISRWREGGHA